MEYIFLDKEYIHIFEDKFDMFHQFYYKVGDISMFEFNKKSIRNQHHKQVDIFANKGHNINSFDKLSNIYSIFNRKVPIFDTLYIFH